MVTVILTGGRHDGKLMEVSGDIVPDTRHIIFATPRHDAWEDNDTSDGYIGLTKVAVEITPRIADEGPAWEVILPKELW